MAEKPVSGEPDSVVQLFLDWLEQQEHAHGPAATFADLCAQHPQASARLEALHAAHERARALFEPGAAGLPASAGGAGARYTLRGELARGGMGTILEVHDPSLRRNIAMKVVRFDARFAAGETGTEAERNQSRLLAEAQILAQLDHPGVVPIHELGRDEHGRAYFTMKRVQGHDFGVVIRAYHAGDPGWSLARAVGVLVRVCEALAYAHQKGVLHRDLKPANVMVGRFGEVFVMDWGLAKVAGQTEAAPVPLQTWSMLGVRPPGASPAPPPVGPSIVTTDRESGSRGSGSAVDTLAGAVLGTPGYMPPEQARAEALDARADVYALGAMLYHLLAGRHPFARDGKLLGSSELVQALLAGPPEGLARLAPHAPEALVAIAEKAMARAKEQRYASMLALREDLQAWLEGRVVRAHRTGAWAELCNWVRRNRGAAAAILAVMLGLAASVTVQALMRRGVERARRETALRAEELRREDAFNRVALASSALSSGEIGHMRALLAGCPEDLRGFEWRHLWRESDTSTHRLEFPGLEVRGVRLFAGRRELLVVGAGPSTARLLLQDLESGARLRELVLQPGEALNNVDFSADGRWLAGLVRLGDLRLWDARDWREVARLDARLHGWHGVAFAPQGLLLAAYGTEGVQLWDMAARTELGLLSAGQRDIADVCWSPDGAHLFAASWDGSVSVWDAATRGLVRVLRDSDQRMQRIACSPDGRWLAGGDWDSRLYVWDARELTLVRRSDRIGGQVLALAWSPDSALLAVGGGGSVVRLFEAGTWERSGRLVGEAGRVNALQFSADGRALVSGSSLGIVRFWDLTRGTGRTLLHEEGREPPAGVAFGADGKLAAVAWGQGTLEFWDTRGRNRVRSLQTGLRIRQLDWSRDGRLLALADWEDGVTLLDPASGAVHLRLPQPQPTEAHFAPDGTLLALSAQDGSLSVWRTEDGAELWRAELAPAAHGWPGDLFGASWSPDGRELVACNFDGLVQVRAGATGAWLRETRRPGMLFAQFAPDGESILVSAYAGNAGLEWLDARTLEPRWTSQHTSHLWPVVAPDGTRVFSANWSGFLGVWDTASGRLVAEIEGLPPGNPRLAVAPDGGCVVLAAGRYLSVFDARAGW